MSSNDDAEDLPSVADACRAMYGTKYPYDTDKNAEQLAEDFQSEQRRRRIAAGHWNQQRRTHRRHS